jgi:superfamily II DNA/RNA helicase
MAGKLLSNPVSVQASPVNTAARTVRQMVYTTDKKTKPALFLHLLRAKRWGQALVFVKTRKGADQLVSLLQAEGISADAIHGDKAQPARLRALERFKAREVQLLVATDVAARGLDIQALPLVVNFDLPTVAEDYVHRIGRTGRAGAEGEAVSLVCADEVELLRAIETLTRQVLKRDEAPGFEADHRVPSTGMPAPNAKAPQPAKRPAPKSPAAAGSRRAAPNPGLPKGAVIVASGRGAKAAAKAAAKNVAKAMARGGRSPGGRSGKR